LLALINDLLDVSKLEAGTLDLHIKSVDAHQAVVRAVTGTRVIASGKGVGLDIRTPSGDVPRVRADEERLQQILTNLLVNAVKFTPQGGSVWVSVEAESSQLTAGGQDVVFRVVDTGVGLAPGQLERVWDRFYQGESSSTRRFGGAGLGLSIVRRLSELHGGRVEANSEGVDRGSTFLVRLPAALESAADAPAPAEPPPAVAAPPEPVIEPEAVPAPNGALVLVVEDDRHIATVLRTYLEADGYRVEVVGDGQQALQAARALEPFAITLDISIPRLDGWSVLNALKREPSTSDIPVVIVSIVDNRDFGMVLGATEFLVKPIDPERLQAILRGIRESRRSPDGALLVVDDDPAIRDMLESVLAQDGWRVVTAADGTEALAEIAREAPAAIVLDLMMPRIDGFEVLHQLRTEPSTVDLPVIVVTAKELNDEDRDRLAGAAQGVILKQALRIDELSHQVRTMLGRHRGRALANAKRLTTGGPV
jgi:DNA-binding response OmpR family regulator